MYVYSLIVSNCATLSYSFTEWRTAFAGGSAYPAIAEYAEILTSIDTVIIIFTFSDLILTLLKPGKSITMAST